MKILKETTDWAAPNHTYILDDKGCLVGYIRQGDSKRIRLSKRVWFSKQDRSFDDVTDQFQNPSDEVET